ncbi:MAG: mevalonate kinase [Halobacteriales archaeon]|nr:mevalonate kinase [Halobacteriales archaeon]
MAEASAPGKAILLGEHAVVYGEPAIAVALDLRTYVTTVPRPGGITVHGEPLQDKLFPHLRKAVEMTGARDVELRIESELPSSAGLGSSAALSCAALGALLRSRGHDVRASEVARLAFDIELATQEGRASPTDTTTSAAGGGVLVDSAPGPGLLWSFERNGKRWHLHRVPVPELTLVVGMSGQRGRTSEQVARVAQVVQRDGLGTVRELGDIARAGAKALAAKDQEELGRLMDRAHAGLRTLGVSTPRLDELVQAARAHSYGAKLTGAGGGGSIIALTREPERVVHVLESKQCPALVAKLTPRGVEAAP